MPNGFEEERRRDSYNADWCRDKHRIIDREIKEMKSQHKDDVGAIWGQIRRQNGMLWGLMGLLLMNFGGVIAILIQAG